MTDFSAMTDKNNEKIDKNKEEPGGLRVKPINNGTVIDHIAGGQALNVLKILGKAGTTGATVSVVMNVEEQEAGQEGYSQGRGPGAARGGAETESH